MSKQQNVTELLRAHVKGDQTAHEELMPIVYDELRRLARISMSKERAGHTLQATELIHEVYLRLIKVHSIEFNDRTHFFSFAAILMRQVLVDIARKEAAVRWGGEMIRVPLDDDLVAAEDGVIGMLALDETLEELASLDEMQSRSFELQVFGGLTVKEIAAVLGTSVNIVNIKLRMAKAWLRDKLTGGG